LKGGARETMKKASSFCQPKKRKRMTKRSWKRKSRRIGRKRGRTCVSQPHSLVTVLVAIM